MEPMAQHNVFRLFHVNWLPDTCHKAWKITNRNAKKKSTWEKLEEINKQTSKHKDGQSKAARGMGHTSGLGMILSE